MLTHWTKKIIVEEGHTVAQLVHILHLLVRHYKVYYPVRHHLIQHMVNSIQRLGFTPNVSISFYILCYPNSAWRQNCFFFSVAQSRRRQSQG